MLGSPRYSTRIRCCLAFVGVKFKPPERSYGIFIRLIALTVREESRITEFAAGDSVALEMAVSTTDGLGHIRHEAGGLGIAFGMTTGSTQ